MNEIENSDVKVNVILNGLEKYMAFIVNKNLVFLVKKLVKTLSDGDFKYLAEEFNSEQLK